MFEDEYANNKKYRKVRDRYHYTGDERVAAHSIYNLKYSISKKNAAVFHDGSYDEMMIIVRSTVKNYSNFLMQQLLQTTKFVNKLMMN